ncbi:MULTISPECIES: (2Fe-2S)-binding protein [Cobetia]|uniref:(2Fe-2S)-binding protein n=1 Tax=Cobetia TaxID=204286 RepID=UPI001C307642|nr:(2Fe-2S)-binding protein [Cobetia sp. 10Alg 146]MDH2291551.1 (2Fe-2S)-binding protein [Cobetia sp. 10Alg 146]
MPNALPFNRLASCNTEMVTVYVDNQPVRMLAHDSAAAAVLAAGWLPSRTTPASGTPRAPYCLMGACFECLLEIDGVASQQGCMITVREGMHIHRQLGARELQFSQERSP